MKLYDFFNSPDKWTKGWLFRCENNIPITSDSPKPPAKFCTLGALQYLEMTEQLTSTERTNKRILLRNEINMSITEWNDSISYEELISTFKKLDI